MKLTAIVAPLQPGPTLPTVASPRQFDAVDELAAALGRATGVVVPVIEGTLEDAPGAHHFHFLELFDAAAGSFLYTWRRCPAARQDHRSTYAREAHVVG